MPSIGDITGRIVIQDAGSAAAIKFGENIDKASKTIIAGMSRATLATETAARKIAADLEKVKLQMKPTDSAKGLIADLDSLNIKLREEISAVRGGPAAIDALNKKRYEQANALRVAAAQAQAGVSAESALGKSIASQFAAHDQLQRELHETASARAKAITLAEQEAERYNRLTQVVTGLAIAFVALTGRAVLQFLKGAVTEAIEAEQAIAQLRAGVESTGAAAGKSTEELSALADELSRLTGFDDELIAGGEAILLTFRRVRGEAFERTMVSALDLSARFGKDINSSVTMIAKALDMLMAGSAKGLSALSKAGVTFTESQKKTMEQLVRTGQAAKAQEMFFRELELQFGGSAEAARDTMGGALRALGIAWSNLKEEVGSGGVVMTGVIEKIIYVIETMTDGIKLFHLGFTLAFKAALDHIAPVDLFLRRMLVTILEVNSKLMSLNPVASDDAKLKAEILVSKARYGLEKARVGFAEASRKLEADAAKQTMAILGILPKVQSKVSDVGEEFERTASKSEKFFGKLHDDLSRSIQSLDLLQQGMPIADIERLVDAAEQLGKTNLLDPLVLKAAALKARIDAIANAFKLAEEAKKKFAEAGDDLDILIKKQFEKMAGGDDAAMRRLIDNLKEAERLVRSSRTDEQKRLDNINKGQQLYNDKIITLAQLQQILIDNAMQFVIVLDQTQVLTQKLYDKFAVVAESIAFDLVDNWRRAWEENESIVDATVDTLRDSFLNVLQDIISQWLSTWFKAMAAWLARWIATQKVAQAASATTTGGFSNSSSGLGTFAYGFVGKASTGSTTGGMSANTLAGYALAAYAIYVVYKGFIEDHKRKFAEVTITDGKYDVTAAHGKKYLDGVQSAAESILNNLKQFLSDIDVTMEHMGTVILESSKSGVNVKFSPTSTGVLFKTMEEAISYAQVLMLKYGQFAESVSLLVRAVITSTKAMKIEDLASDIAWARKLETQNLEDFAKSMRDAVNEAEVDWKRAQDLFMGFYDSNLPAFAEAVTSILTRLINNIWATYNQLAGIEEDPAKAWERKRVQYRTERAMIEAQLRLYRVQVEQWIANLKAHGSYLGGLGGMTRGTLGLAKAMVMAAEVMDPALQELVNILALLDQTIKDLPPLELPETDPGKKGGKGGKDRKSAREDLRDEIKGLEAEAKGPLHAAFNDLNNNLAAFRERAKEAKLPAAELAKGVELLTEAFRRSVQAQARDYAGLDTELGKRLREIQDFFDEVRELGPDKTGITAGEADSLESQALAKLGADISKTILEFAGLSDPMLAITLRANDLRQSVLEFAEAAGWSAEQIDEALRNIEKGIEGQRLQGINTAMGTLLGILKQAGLYEKEALEFDRQNLLMQLQLLEAQFRFYNALDAKTQEMIDAAREFVRSDAFGNDNNNDNDVVRVRVVNSTNDWDEIVDKIKNLVDSWREAVKQFADSTAQLMTDEGMTNLTQDQQLAFAKSQVETLAAKAQSGDIEALAKLEQARAEYLSELRDSEAGGFGFDKGWDWVMNLTAGVLENAQSAEDALIARELEKNVQAWSYVMGKLGEQLEAAFYTNTQDLIDAIYNAIGGVPGFASGGIVMRGPRLVRVSEYVPEAIVPLDKLANMIPYTINASTGNMDTYRGRGGNGGAGRDIHERNTLARLSSVEQSNDKIAKALMTIKDDIGAMRRSR